MGVRVSDSRKRQRRDEFEVRAILEAGTVIARLLGLGILS